MSRTPKIPMDEFHDKIQKFLKGFKYCVMLDDPTAGVDNQEPDLYFFTNMKKINAQAALQIGLNSLKDDTATTVSNYKGE